MVWYCTWGEVIRRRLLLLLMLAALGKHNFRSCYVMMLRAITHERFIGSILSSRHQLPQQQQHQHQSINEITIGFKSPQSSGL